MDGWKRIVGIFLAMNGIGCGVAIFLQTQLGSDPVGILCDGIHKFLNIEFGNASLLYNLLLIGLALLMAKKNIGFGSIIYAVSSGYFIDFYSWILSFCYLHQKELYLRISIYAIGLLLFTFSLSILIKCKLGMNALDAVLWKLSEEYRISYIILRLVIDFLYVVIGYLLGGTFGIGTILCILSVGTLIKMFTNVFTLNINKIKSQKRRRI